MGTSREITESKGTLRVMVSTGKNLASLRGFLGQVLVGRNVHEKQINNIIGTPGISGKKLARFVKQRDLHGLIKLTGTTSHTASELFSALSGTNDFDTDDLSPISSQLFEFEAIWPGDEAQLEIFHTDINEYRAFSAFSPGQQCSALFNILLKASDKPLIIDQPEDEQDWFYVDEFIQQLRKAKCNRGGDSGQFIFVTHDQNIPVPADSEKVFKVKNIPLESRKGNKRGAIEASGGVERQEVKKAILSLEGGA